ncbi:globin domain-containing protein [Kitasatospora sp. NPDC091207]|uniref:globin domain-containing protein n=1 Tax=Kitasatospora sp. NPDC091207 TaxID=3364083 RepID=UPI003812E838
MPDTARAVRTDTPADLPPMPLDPPDLPPVSAPLVPPAPAPFAPAAAVPAAAVPPWPAIPAPPAVPPVIPAPSMPTGQPGPTIEPLFTRAPGLNWTAPAAEPVPGLRSAPWSDPAAGSGPVGATGSAGPAEAEQPPTARDIELIRTSLAVVEPVADRATAHFYALIFLHHPEVRALFPAAMDVQRDRLFRALLMAARSAGDPDGLRAYLSALGRGHRRYGTLTGHYGPVGECLVAALARYAGSRWDAETELAWRRVYRLVSSIMIEAAEEDARTSPPWWQAEVVGHELRTPDVAVLTLRPDQAYPFRAGQYTSLETPWWPRVWRYFSFASAPRPDGLLTLHVKAVQAGWVSNALVHRAVPGDVLRLGPAAGTMTVDHTAGTDLLCLGGGTGIAPIKALVEEVADHGAAGRSVEVFYGARRAAELYELEALRGLAERHRWLSVHPVLSGPGPHSGGPVVGGGLLTGGLLTGELPEVVGRFGSWAGREAYLGGPAAMVRRGVGVLLRAGVAPERIRHDLVGDLAAG